MANGLVLKLFKLQFVIRHFFFQGKYSYFNVFYFRIEGSQQLRYTVSPKTMTLHSLLWPVTSLKMLTDFTEP